jgi:hypothetical protein
MPRNFRGIFYKKIKQHNQLQYNNERCFTTRMWNSLSEAFKTA